MAQVHHGFRRYPGLISFLPPYIKVTLTQVTPDFELAGTHFNTPQGNWFLGLACFWILFGAVEVAKYVAHQGKVELLKEVKQVQLQILELHASIEKGGTSMSGETQLPERR